MSFHINIIKNDLCLLNNLTSDMKTITIIMIIMRLLKGYISSKSGLNWQIYLGFLAFGSPFLSQTFSRFPE